MSQQTAVEYLIEEIKKNRHIHNKSTKEWNEVFREAKAMEKEQIMKAIEVGYNQYFNQQYDSTEQYYNENYNK
jgi:hypothetical protein